MHDVLLDSPADNEVLAYDSVSSLWKNQTAAEAGLAAASHTHGMADLTDFTISSPTAGQSLTYDGSKWVNSTPAASVAGDSDQIVLSSRIFG
jgi:hypothetical protein